MMDRGHLDISALPDLSLASRAILRCLGWISGYISRERASSVSAEYVVRGLALILII